MKELIETKQNLYGGNNIVEIYLSDELPDLTLCTSAYGFVFKDGMFLQTELREGERPERRLDIPGGHIDERETPDQAAIRETFEETGVHIDNAKLVAVIKITNNKSKEESSLEYPYPVSYMLFYLCDFVTEEVFEGNEDTHGRVWVSPKDFPSSIWCKENKILFNRVLNLINIEK